MNDNDKNSNEKQSSAAHSSADSVEQHLRQLEQTDDVEQRYYSQEQPFSSDELARIINEARLKELLVHSDEFLSHLSGKIDNFD